MGLPLRNVLANYTGIHAGGSIIDDAILGQQMIMVNPGLHELMRQVEMREYLCGIGLMILQMRRIAAAQRNIKILPSRFVVDDITSIIDAELTEGKRKLLYQSMVMTLTRSLKRSWQRPWTCKIPDSGVLPANRLTGI